MSAVDDVTLAHALVGQTVAVRATDGSHWSGTVNWLVRDDCPAVNEPTRAIDTLIGQTFDQPLSPVKHGAIVVSADTTIGRCRLYQRGDGKTVAVLDANMRAVEWLREGEDEDGAPYPATLELRQAGHDLGPIGVHEGGDLVALVMPTRLAL